MPQDLTSLGGKLLRVDASTGAAAPGNPFGTRVYTYGHRNPQGLALRPGTDQMWAVEHGPTLDDEINLLVAGANYGWNPGAGYDENVPMTDLDEFSAAREAHWSSGDRTLAISGGMFLEGDAWGAWDGRLAVAALKDRSLSIFEFTRAGAFVSRVVPPELDGIFGRLRTPTLGPDNALYISTSNGGGSDQILKVEPARSPSTSPPVSPPPGGDRGGGDGGDGDGGGGGGGDAGGDGDGSGEGGDGADSGEGPPRASFMPGANCGEELCRARTDEPVTFEDTSTGLVRFRTWDFGDGTRSRGRTIEHSWATPGFYDVVLTVSGGGAESTFRQTFLVEASNPAGTCKADVETRCLRNSRYRVRVTLWTPDGEHHAGKVVHAGSNDSAMFYFFDGNNWEVLIKVLDGCALNGHAWVYGASATTLAYRIVVADTLTGAVREYLNEQGRQGAGHHGWDGVSGRLHGRLSPC